MRTTVPATVAESVDRRLATLHPRTQQVLRTAALLGAQIDISLLGRITGLDDETVLAALREAGYAQLLDGSGADVRFRHALTRDRVAALLLPTERIALAGRAAAAVREAHPDLPGPWCELVASLAEQAGDTVAAARHLVEAGRRAQVRGALDTATVRLERALELAGPAEPEATAAPEALAARTALAQVRALAGDVEGALRLGPLSGGPIDGSGGSGEDAELQLTLVRALLTAGRLTEARARITEVLRGAVDARPDDRLQALVLAAEVEIADGDTENARRRAGAALARSGDDLPEVRCAAFEVPWARTGDIGCAASPSSNTPGAVHTGQRPTSTASRTGPSTSARRASTCAATNAGAARTASASQSPVAGSRDRPFGTTTPY